MKVVCIVLIVGWPFFQASQVLSQTTSIVVPSGFSTIDGNSSSGEFVNKVREQTLIAASQFDDLPAGRTVITQMALRPDESVRSPIEVTFDYQLRFSTKSAYHLNTTFADNAGADETVVYDGDITWSTSGEPTGVKPFDYVVDLQTPFFYDPSRGSLLVEQRAPSGFAVPPNVDQISEAADLIRVGTFEGEPGEVAVDAQHRGNIPIRQFSFVTTYFGDANLDGEFNGDDLLDVLAAGEYEDNIPGNSSWTTGDWDGDRDFTTNDLLLAFADGGYEQGPRETVNAVPEPTSVTILAVGLLAIFGLCRPFP